MASMKTSGLQHVWLYCSIVLAFYISCGDTLDCYSCIDEEKIDSSNCDSDNSTVTCEENQVCIIRREEHIDVGRELFTKGCGDPCPEEYCDDTGLICTSCCDDSSFCNGGYPPGSGCMGSSCIYGDCVQEALSYKCLCHSGITGKYCSDFWGCFPSPCSNGGSCFPDFQNEYLCFCGEETTIQDKNDDDCICFKLQGYVDYKCECPLSYTGRNCTEETLPNACDPNPCDNGGSCSVLKNGNFWCDCMSSFTGYHCNISSDHKPINCNGVGYQLVQRGEYITDIGNYKECYNTEPFYFTRCQGPCLFDWGCYATVSSQRIIPMASNNTGAPCPENLIIPITGECKCSMDPPPQNQSDCKLEETNYAAQSFTPSSLPLNPNRVCTNTNSFSIGVCYGFCSDEGYKCDGTYHTVFVDIACRKIRKDGRLGKVVKQYTLSLVSATSCCCQSK